MSIKSLLSYLLFFVVILTGCTASDVSGLNVAEGINLSQILVPVSRVPLFADVSSFNLFPNSPETRAFEELVSLESLLDYEAKRQIDFGESSMELIPFFQNNEEILAGLSDAPMEFINNPTCIKKYYIVSSNRDLSVSFIVTMITGFDYSCSHPVFDFFDKPNYSGIILFSSLEGELVEARLYKGGLVLQASPIIPGEVPSDSLEVVYFALASGISPTTRDGINGGELIPSICCAGLGVKYNWINPSWCFGSMTSGRTGGGVGGSANHNGAGNGPSQQSADEAGEEVLPLLPCVDLVIPVTLSSNIPDVVTMLGAGRYVRNTKIVIDYVLNNYGHEEPSFSHWAGLSGSIKGMPFLLTVTEVIDATAYFYLQKPCSDETEGITNPLKNMSVAATGVGNYLGGTYGYTRKKLDSEGNVVSKFHNGIDFAADIGTPVFAMYSGTVTDVRTSALNGYEPRSYGNVIRVQSINTNGKIFETLYAHLNCNNGVTSNPRTGQIFSIGDQVYRGDLIGYTGKTGNAWNDDVPNKHLHLSVFVGGSTVDPVSYINGTIDPDTIQATRGEVSNIQCD